MSSSISRASSSSSTALHSQGCPARHMHPRSLCHGRSGWHSHTHPTPKQMRHMTSIRQPGTIVGAGWSRGVRAVPFLPAYRTPHFCRLVGGTFPDFIRAQNDFFFRGLRHDDLRRKARPRTQAGARGAEPCRPSLHMQRHIRFTIDRLANGTPRFL